MITSSKTLKLLPNQILDIKSIKNNIKIILKTILNHFPLLLTILFSTG